MGRQNGGSENDTIWFGPFCLFSGGRLIEKNGSPLAVSSRALDILIVLARRPGEVVSKRELISQVWPGLTVAESCLRVHVAGLRKALGDGQGGARYVMNVPGRGYCFVAPVIRGEEISQAWRDLALIDRNAASKIRDLAGQLRRHADGISITCQKLVSGVAASNVVGTVDQLGLLSEGLQSACRVSDELRQLISMTSGVSMH